MADTNSAQLIIHGKTFELPIIKSTEGDQGIDIRKLRTDSGFITYDSGFANTGSCSSNITFIDGEKGILRYRGYDIDDLAKNCLFTEVAYLLVHGKLPTENELKQFSAYLTEHSMIHEDMHHFFNGMPSNSHPMAILSAMITTLSSFYPHSMNEDDNFDETAARLMSKIRTIAAFSYKKSLGEPVVYPKQDLPYCANFLNMMFDSPIAPYDLKPLFVEAMNKLFILHADHEQNCSTSTIRTVASAGINLYASISAGISALWGPLHGGANQAVIEMLRQIKKDGNNYKKYIEKAKDKNDPFRLMGFGHAVYKNFDPRSKIIKKLCDDVFASIKFSDPLLDIAKELEEAALKDQYFIDRKLYPNVDFYSGIIYRALGFPTNMMTVLFAIGRLPGWIAQWRESTESKEKKIWRPRQIYTGPTKLDFVPIKKRMI
jgi:citrate synthase